MGMVISFSVFLGFVYVAFGPTAARALSVAAALLIAFVTLLVVSTVVMDAFNKQHMPNNIHMRSE